MHEDSRGIVDEGGARPGQGGRESERFGTLRGPRRELPQILDGHMHIT